VKRLPSGGAKHNQVEEKLAGPTGDVSVRVDASEYLLLNVRCMVCTIRTTSLLAEAWREYASRSSPVRLRSRISKRVLKLIFY